jgi:hypothetical protein
MARLQSFAQWLARHAGLVKSLYVSATPCSYINDNEVIDGLPYEAHLAAAQELLQLSIHAAGDSTRLSAPLPGAAAAAERTASKQQQQRGSKAVRKQQGDGNRCAAAAAAAAAAATAAIVTEETAEGSILQQQQALCLRSFSSSLPKAVDMLAALQVQHLTCVELDFRKANTDSSKLSSALVRLSNLQQLRLGDMLDTSLGTALTTLVPLPQLTLLQFWGEWPSYLQIVSAQTIRSARTSRVLASPVSDALQQLLAQPLPLKSLQLSVYDSYQLPVLNMGLLTNLTELSTGRCLLEAATVLPAQLQRLHIHSWAGAHSMAPLTLVELQQLQHLSVRVDFEQPQLLLQLAQLPALTHLALQYDDFCEGQAAAATASAWPMLPQLRELEIVHDEPPSQPAWEAILAGAAAAGGLTKLTCLQDLTKLALDTRMMSDEIQGENLENDDGIGERRPLEVAACARLAKLTCLQDLTVGCGDGYAYGYVNPQLVRGDALALTALTRLTRLVLAGAQHGVGTAVATALACSLQQLQSLDLGDCGLQLGGAEGLACLEAIGSLTQLTSLRLSGNAGLTLHGLMQLTGLSRLEEAAFGGLCSAAADSDLDGM